MRPIKNNGQSSGFLVSLSLHILLLVFSVFMLYPLLWMVASSFRTNGEILNNFSLIPSVLNLKNYKEAWSALTYSFGTFAWNSLLISVLTVIGNVMSCSVTAFAFARLNFKGRNFWFAIMLGTLMMPQHAVMIPQYVMFLKIGWLDTYLPLVVPKFFAIDAFFIFLMVQFFRGIPKELDEAAQMDGCGPWRIYLKILLPLSMPVLATTAIFSFIWSWGDFFGPLIYLNEMKSYTVQLGLRSFIDATSISDWVGLFAMSTLALLPVFIVFLFFQRMLIEGVATTGMKR
ncbi:MAG: carbohydrate ABC transporter permease [Comamonadaceae bacterium]|nr:MAG: carbohydrate ABC transporter permease [Comamonadaceae bacterium]